MNKKLVILLTALALLCTSSCENGIKNWSAPSVIGADLSIDQRNQPQIKELISQAGKLDLQGVSKQIDSITSGPIQFKEDCHATVPLPEIKPVSSSLNQPPLPQHKPQLQFAQNEHSTTPFETLESKATKTSLSLWATNYYTPVYSVTESGIALKRKSEKPLRYKGQTVSLSKRRWCLAAMEGSVTIRMKDGANKTYNYSGVGSMQTDCTVYFKGKHRATGRVKFSEVKSAWGMGVKNYSLIPYRTIAVDPKVIPYGSVIYIEEAVGREITLADGTNFTHDGYFFAGDTGGAIKNNHIDIFTGNNSRPNLSFVKSIETHKFSASLVHDEALKAKLENLHRRTY